jgi:hypothetical protein
MPPTSAPRPLGTPPPVLDPDPPKKPKGLGNMRTKIIEGVQSLERPGNWGKFMLAVPDEEWARGSLVCPGGPLLSACGWGHEHVWVLDLQTGEGAFFRPGGVAHADLEKHRIWVCVLFESFLEWLYAQYREDPRLDIESLPDVVELPGAEFAFSGYRRPGPEGEPS